MELMDIISGGDLVSKMPYGAKVRKLYNKQFYLAHRCYEDLLDSLEAGVFKRQKEVVDFIDRHGEWLDG